ncbi:MAG: molybdopterin-dependent oxidoreductase [Gemmatimonadetes bacterium]|nr:molybdopterin-dependent oxidoreductase [Gemmatimonadota bacterium]
MDGSANDQIGAADNVVAFPPGSAEADMATSGVARHRRHRFPGRTESVRARYDTEELAAVAAETKEAAEMAAELVRVDYQVLPGVYSVADAIAPGAPLVQDPSLRPGDPLANTNAFREHRYGWGEVDTAYADLIVENTYTFPLISHFAIEPHGSMAAPDEDGVMIWSPVQHPFLLQKIAAKVLGLPLSRVRVQAPDPGGAFGGKQNPKYEPLVAFIALRTGRPARLILTLAESFQASRRASAQMRMRVGFRADGTITFLDFDSYYLIGAYVDIADRLVGKSNYLAGGPYRIPAARVVARGLLSHTTPAMAMRGFGIPQVTWARESIMDEAARKLGIDPLELRIRNLASKGEEFLPGETAADGDWLETVRRTAEMIGWGTPLPRGRGRGIAFGLKSGPTTGLSYATVRLLADGSAIVYSGTSDMGQGARTIFAQIAAEELGTPFDRVSVVMGDTGLVPYDQQTSASRSSVLMGTAIQRACRHIKQQIRAMTARAYGVDEESVSVERGVVRIPDRELSAVEVLKAGLGRLGGELIGNGEMRVDPDPDHGLGGKGVFFEFNCNATEVEVDPDTGEVVLTRHVTVGDVGRALNPRQVAAQDEGATIMGLGHTLMEEIILDETGRIRNMGATDYRILTSMDLPLELRSASIENGDGPGPYGIKGVSEGGLLATSPAVSAAITAATGVVFRDLPLTPERIWRAMRDQRASAADPIETSVIAAE